MEKHMEIVWHLEEAEESVGNLLYDIQRAVIISKEDVRLQALYKRIESIKDEILLLIEEELE